MNILKIGADVFGIIARDLVGKGMLAAGITGIIGGSIIVPIVVLNFARAFESTREWATVLTAIASLATLVVSISMTAIGAFILYRGRNS